MAGCGRPDCCGGSCSTSQSKSQSYTNPQVDGGSKSGASVPLPRSTRSKLDPGSEPVWEVEAPTSVPNLPGFTKSDQLDTIMAGSQPLTSACAVEERDGKCCKDLKGEDERRLISPEIVRDVIIGLSDGLTVPFALTAGLSGLGSSRIVVTGGLAELCAGAISMGVGGFLASQAELDHFHYLRRQTRARVARSCSGEMEREVHSILGPLGVKESISRFIAEDLRQLEHGGNNDASTSASNGVETPSETTGLVSGRNKYDEEGKRRWWSWKKRDATEEDGGVVGNEDMGLTAFLLKFGEGMEEVPKSRLYISALTIGMSYFVGGLIPLLPYFANVTTQEGLFISCIITGVILFIFGGFKTYFTGATGGIGGYIWGATSTMIVGGVAAAAAYGLVAILQGEE